MWYFLVSQYHCWFVGRADVGVNRPRRVHSRGEAIVYDCDAFVWLEEGSESDVGREVIVKDCAGDGRWLAFGWCRHVAYWYRGRGYAHADGVACGNQHVES